MRFWNGPQLLIIDELGYLPMPAEAAATSSKSSRRRYEHGSIILTTNRGIADWGEIFDDTTVAAAILDRLLHHATVLADRRRQLPHARPPRPPPDPQSRLNHPAEGGESHDRNWGILTIVDTAARSGGGRGTRQVSQTRRTAARAVSVRVRPRPDELPRPAVRGRRRRPTNQEAQSVARPNAAVGRAQYSGSRT